MSCILTWQSGHGAFLLMDEADEEEMISVFHHWSKALIIFMTFMISIGCRGPILFLKDDLLSHIAFEHLITVLLFSPAPA